jgi:serine/threonine-protein kinase
VARLLVVLLVSLRLWAGGAHAQTAHFSEAQATVPVVDLLNPTGMAVDASGNIYVADNSSNLLWKYTSSGPVAGGGYFYSGEGNPYGIAVDGAGNLYFTDSVSNQIVKETIFPNGTGTRTVVPITGLSTPRGIAVDTQGNLYIADYGNNRVVEATPSGSTYTQRTVPTSSLSMPEAVAVDGSGNLYVADTLHLRVLQGDALRKHLERECGREPGKPRFWETGEHRLGWRGRCLYS